MQVKEILRVKGNRLLTIEPAGRAVDAVRTMSEQNLGSLVVLDQGRMVGMLTFREVIQAVVRNGGAIGWSRWQWASTPPGVTTRPAASISRAPAGRPVPSWVI